MTLPEFMSPRGRLRAQNRSSARQEARHAASQQGRVQAGSGTSWRAKGDVVSAQHVDELKETDAKSYSVTVAVIRKIVRAAEQLGREPRLIIDFKSHGIRAVITFEDL